MNKEELENEMRIAEKAYSEEINKNGGHDGTTLSLILKSRFKMLNDIKLRYYND